MAFYNILQHFRKDTSFITGLDIGTNFVKRLDLTGKDTKVTIQNINLAALPAGAIDDNTIFDHGAVSKAIALVCNSNAPNTLITAISGANVAIKKITMNAYLDQASLEAQVWLEAGKHFPELIEDLSFDFQILKNHGAENPAKMEVLLVACRKQNVEIHMQMLKTVGLKATALDVDYYALARAYNFIAQEQEHNKVIGVLNLTPNENTFVIIHNQQLIFSRKQACHNNALLPAIFTSLKLEATPSANSSELAFIHQNLLLQIQQNLQVFYSTSNYSQLDKLVLCGEGALLEDITHAIAAQLEITTTIANPFSTTCNNLAAGVISQGPAFMIAFGLSLYDRL